MKKIFLLTVLLAALNSLAFAAQDYYQFADTTQAKRFNSLTKELRCLVCENESLADSNAALARDLRKQISEKIAQGQTDMEILDYLVTRYGHYVVFNPPLNSETWLLWFTPAILLIFGLLYLVYYIDKNRKREHVVNN